MNTQCRHYQAFFGYTGKQKYIKLVQTYPDDPNTLQRCFLLDQELSIIVQSDHQDLFLQRLDNNESSDSSPIFYTVDDIKTSYWFQRHYSKYPQINDFLIGRENWGRIENAMKISSDQISRDHTRISRTKSIQSKEGFLSIIKKTIQSVTQHSSKWRKMPTELLQTIVDYILDRPCFWIQDCSSRNGTFLIDYSLERHRLLSQQAYQFQNETYTINILQKTWTKGTDICKTIQQYQPNLNYLSSKYIHNQVIFPRGMSKQTIEASEEEYKILLLQCNVSHELKFLHWIINRNEDAYYSIGQGQIINVSYTIHSSEIRRHGYIVFQQGEWYIMGVNKESKVWVRLQPNAFYALDKKRYKLMVGHHSVLQLQFHNF